MEMKKLMIFALAAVMLAGSFAPAASAREPFARSAELTEANRGRPSFGRRNHGRRPAPRPVQRRNNDRDHRSSSSGKVVAGGLIAGAILGVIVGAIAGK
jgi:hypothetical protein